ncbi:Replication factor C subunit 3 [Senna tora]|uniref:Replication factor C subunit 3 n=1 Tax=Senna tora TaxID=362788 RepID=A0A834T914_9FABA|nr:Replication factor C subunit 3 [Senna tora]
MEIVGSYYLVKLLLLLSDNRLSALLFCSTATTLAEQSRDDDREEDEKRRRSGGRTVRVMKKKLDEAYWENEKVRLDYRPVHMNTLDDEMETIPPKARVPEHLHISSELEDTRFIAKEGQSGYEPSDTETEWQETPRHERERKNLSLGAEGPEALNIRNKSPVSLALHQRHASRFELESSSSPPRRRHHRKSPYKPIRPEPDGDDDPIQRNISPLPKPDHGRHLSPYKSDSVGLGVKRSVTALRQRGREKEQHNNFDKTHGRSPSIAEINEMVAEAKFLKDPRGNTNTDTNNIDIASTESILPEEPLKVTVDDDGLRRWLDGRLKELVFIEVAEKAMEEIRV